MSRQQRAIDVLETLAGQGVGLVPHPRGIGIDAPDHQLESWAQPLVEAECLELFELIAGCDHCRTLKRRGVSVRLCGQCGRQWREAPHGEDAKAAEG